MAIKKRVLVAMSGGVDSSVAAYLLKTQGYDVVGVTMQVWDYTACNIEEGFGTCCSSLDVDDARAVADRLDFPFYVINCEAQFKAQVIDPFMADYISGKTPIPCVNCNTFLKFDYLVQKMEELECEALATGHYARLEFDADRRPTIVTSTDDFKDQTYFLFTLAPAILPRLMFPVGHLNKPEVRRIAEAAGLITARKKDSTGVCFLGEKSHGSFIEENSATLPPPGDILEWPGGERLGTHPGIHHFTVGQRKGIGAFGPKPLYVVKIDPRRNQVWLGPEEALYKSRMWVGDSNLLDQIRAGEKLRVKIRFQHKGAQAELKPLEDQTQTGFEVVFDEPQRAITPGQAAVFYRGGQLVGGGWIRGAR